MISIYKDEIIITEPPFMITVYVFNVLVKVSFAYFCFSRLPSSNVNFYRISALNSIWE